MKRIPLTQGQFALVDDEDYRGLSRHKWYAHWDAHTRSYYAMREIRLANGKRTTELMCRRILGLTHGDPRQGDHLDHNTLDNRRSNIRIVTHQENTHNRRSKGFSWDRSKKKFMAYIGVNGVQKYLGYYDDPAEARAAYLAAKKVYHPSASILDSATSEQ